MVEEKLPFRLSFQGDIEKDRDKEIVDFIIGAIRDQPEVFNYGSGMAITMPDFYMFFKSHKGRDFCVIAMNFGYSILHIKELKCRDDIPWAYVDDGKVEIPEDMRKRLKIMTEIV